MLAVRGGSEAFYAYPAERDATIDVGELVLVVEYDAPRTGKGTTVLPGFQTARRLSLDTQGAQLQAGYQAEIDRAAGTARQSGPLAEASARQEVVVQETRAAQLEADLAEQRLQSQVRKPADARETELRAAADARETELGAAADAKRVEAAATAEASSIRARGLAQAEATRATGEAEAAATQARGLAEAESARARGLAEAQSIQARAKALAENQEAVVAQQLAEQWPDIVAAGASAFSNVDHMVVLNGADGVSELLAKALTMGGTGLGLARQILADLGTDPKPSATGSTAGLPTPRN